MTFTDYLKTILKELSEKGTFGLEDIKEVIRKADYNRVDEFGEISAFSNNATTVLYSGMMDSGAKTHDYVLTIQDRCLCQRCYGSIEL